MRAPSRRTPSRWISSQGAAFEILLASPLNEPVEGVQYDLAIEQDGVRSTMFDATFQPCIGAAAVSGIDPGSLNYQRQALEIVDGVVLQVDDWGGYECETIDGEGFGAIP